MGFGLKHADVFARFLLLEHQKVSTNNSRVQSAQAQWSLTGGAGSPAWFIRAGAHKAVGLCEAEVSAAAIIYPAEVGA